VAPSDSYGGNASSRATKPPWSSAAATVIIQGASTTGAPDSRTAAGSRGAIVARATPSLRQAVAPCDRATPHLSEIALTSTAGSVVRGKRGRAADVTPAHSDGLPARWASGLMDSPIFSMVCGRPTLGAQIEMALVSTQESQTIESHSFIASDCRTTIQTSPDRVPQVPSYRPGAA
jgi:hypothetical protein